MRPRATGAPGPAISCRRHAQAAACASHPSPPASRGGRRLPADPFVVGRRRARQLAGFDLPRAHAEAAAGNEREDVAVYPRRGCLLAALGEDPQPAGEPARLAGHIAGGVALDAPAPDGDLAEAQSAALDHRERYLAKPVVEHYGALEHTGELGA